MLTYRVCRAGVCLLLLAVAAAARPVPTVFMITKDPGCPDGSGAYFWVAAAG
jgi:hypothetical protein